MWMHPQIHQPPGAHKAESGILTVWHPLGLLSYGILQYIWKWKQGEECSVCKQSNDFHTSVYMLGREEVEGQDEIYHYCH